MKKIPRELYGALCKLKDYEETGLEPDKAAEIDAIYLDKCKEVNRLKSQIENSQKAAEQPVLSEEGIANHNDLAR